MNLKGDLVFSEERAETLSEYFEKLQWHVRPDTIIIQRPSIFDMLHIDVGSIKQEEIEQAIKELKKNKSAGPDEIIPEMWKSFLHDGEIMT